MYRRTPAAASRCACSSVEQPERARDLESGLALHRVDRVDHAPQQPLLGPAHGDDDAELGRACVPGRVRGGEDLVEVEERDRRRRREWWRTDCEQNAQSSGHAPDLALMRLSSSTSGPHQASRTLCASAISDGSSSSGRSRDGERFVTRERAGAREQRPFGGLERHGGGSLLRRSVRQETRAARTGPIISA